MRRAPGAATTDLVGVGFGPANLALAIALAEYVPPAGGTAAPRARFFEKQSGFGWHRGMLIDGATMQVSFLKDLVTPRDPTSPLSFLSYLHANGRTAEFINRKSFFPYRTEFHAYLEWAAARVAADVSYGSEVVGLRAAGDGNLVDVVVRHGGSLLTQRTRNVVLATGLEPHLPDGVRTGERVWHSSEFLHRVGAIAAGQPRRFVVVGAGQSAAEAVGHLHERFPYAQVHAVHLRYGYSVADNSAFANQIFDPAAVDHFFAAPPGVKDMLARYHANTNYSVVDTDLIQDLYDRSYREGLTGDRRLHMHGASRLRGHHPGPDSVRVAVEFLPTGEVTTLTADAVVFATGYRPADPATLLGELGALCHRDEHGRLLVDRQYRVCTGDALRAGIYLQGPTEHSHGISSTLLSNVAVRAGEIVAALTSQHRREEPGPCSYPADMTPGTRNGIAASSPGIPWPRS
ncbi:SidA/IucD/PvdA family monooxygenase [Actinoplanes sp. NPDC049316]|uniref:lysine N(6)-hydroxylase/L-ornithine N(5)-oxygenase family protein n=1 Tax=Actinoplanes sp. NPDC049316 TaxID=3154727 RepID=UPI00343CB052